MRKEMMDVLSIFYFNFWWLELFMSPKEYIVINSTKVTNETKAIITASYNTASFYDKRGYLLAFINERQGNVFQINTSFPFYCTSF